MTDYYSILGVTKESSAEDIKSAYRKLAMKYHPDRGGDQKKFQEIQEAYATLGDPEKRQAYDNPARHAGHDFQFNFSDMGFPDDIMRHFFGGGFGMHQRMRKNKDIRIQLDIPISEAMSDISKILNIKTSKTTHQLNINIPRGVPPGTTIRYTGHGDDLHDQLPRGDLYVIINLVLPFGWNLMQNHLITQINIDAFDAILGCEREILTVDGKTLSVKIPAGVQPGNKLSIKGQGYYLDNIRGDLIISVNIDIPKDLTESQLNLVKKIKVGL